MTTSLPGWMVPPRPEGWIAEDLDDLWDAPKHTELWDGALVFMMSPQREWHRSVIYALETALREQAPQSSRVLSEMTVRLDERTRPEPDLVVTTAPPDRKRTFYRPEEVTLAVEVVSPESVHRDRNVKPDRYATAGIQNFWRVEEDPDTGDATVYVYELDLVTRTYVAKAIARDELLTDRPFPIRLDVRTLTH